LARFLETFDWPGNVRQLRNCLENMVVMSDHSMLTMDDLPPNIASGNVAPTQERRTVLGSTIGDLEKTAMLQALDRCQGNRTQAAKSLGVSVRTLQRRLRSWGIEGPPEDTVSHQAQCPPA